MAKKHPFKVTHSAVFMIPKNNFFYFFTFKLFSLHVMSFKMKGDGAQSHLYSIKAGKLNVKGA